MADHSPLSVAQILDEVRDRPVRRQLDGLLFAYCKECETLYLGVTGKALCCPHRDERGWTHTENESQYAKRVRIENAEMLRRVVR